MWDFYNHNQERILIIPIFHARPLQIIHARTRTVILSTAYPKTTVPPSITESLSPDGLFHKKT